MKAFWSIVTYCIMHFLVEILFSFMVAMLSLCGSYASCSFPLYIYVTATLYSISYLVMWQGLKDNAVSCTLLYPHTHTSSSLSHHLPPHFRDKQRSFSEGPSLQCCNLITVLLIFLYASIVPLNILILHTLVIPSHENQERRVVGFMNLKDWSKIRYHPQKMACYGNLIEQNIPTLTVFLNYKNENVTSK